MNARAVSAAAGVVHAAMQTHSTAAGIAAAVDAAGMLMSPETAAELASLREKDARQRLALESARRGRRALRVEGGRMLADQVEALSDAAETLRAQAALIAELEQQLRTARDDRDMEIARWLGKKAREYRSTGSRQHAVQADAIELMVSKLVGGAVRAEPATVRTVQDVPTGGAL